MSIYSKYLILVGCVGLIGIPIFILNFSDLSWQSNKETYWGMIALCGLIGTVIFENRAKNIEKRIKKDKEEGNKTK